MDSENLSEIVEETRRLLSEGDPLGALSWSGEAVARFHARWGEAVREKTPSAALLRDLLFATDNHIRILFTQNLYTDIFTTAIVALAQATADETFTPHKENPDDVERHIAAGRMLLLADALAALMRHVEANPPAPESPEADHLSAMVIETASILYDAYREVLADSPDNPDLHEVYAMLRQLQPAGAIRSAVNIAGKETPVDDTGAYLGDLLGRALAIGWLKD